MTAALQVAFDVGPLRGHRTGVGAAVSALANGFAARPAGTGEGVELRPYLLSARARTGPGERRLPMPAALAHHLWARLDRPRLDRWFADVDVIHGTNYVVPPSRTPRLVSVYDCWFLARPELAGSAVGRAAAVLRRAVRGGAHVHASSQATAQLVRSLLGTDRVTTIHLGPPTDEPPPDRAPISALPRGPYIVAIGTRERRKNLPRLIEAFGLLSEHVDVDLVIAGASGDDDVAVQRALGALRPRARRRAWVLGAVDEATKSWLVHRARVIAYPSLDEGFGFPVLQAQLVGVPIVAAAAGSIPEIGGDGVEYVDPLDVSSLATGLGRATVDESRRAELVSAGHRNVSRFSWGDTVERLAELYGAIAGDQR